MAHSLFRSFHRFAHLVLQAEEYQAAWRRKNQRNFRMYDGDQWDDKDMAILEERGQAATVLNITRPTIDMIMALESQKRTDTQIVAREASDVLTADTLTEGLKQIYDENDYHYFQAQAFREALIGGIGWMELGEEKDEAGLSTIFAKWTPWEEVFWDPFFRRPDAGDARFINRRIWMNVDQAKEKWPSMADDIQTEVNMFSALDIVDEDFKGHEVAAQERALRTLFFDRKNLRVGIHETWYKTPGDEVKKVLWTGNTFLEGGKEDSQNDRPFKMNMIPLIPMIASRNKDGEPLGVVQIIRSIQETLNKVNSKYLWTISGRRAIFESGTVTDPEEVREELAKPDGIIVLEPGAFGKFQTDGQFQESTHLMSMMTFLVQMAQRVSGVNDALLGIGGTNARTAQQETSRLLQGAQLQTSLVENLYFTKRQSAKVAIRLMGEFYNGDRIIRITQPDGGFEFRALNVTEGADGTPDFSKIDDILKYDVVIKEVSPFSTVREHSLAMIIEAVKVGAIPLEVAGKVIIELSDIPNKERILADLNQSMQAQQEQQQALQFAPGQPKTA